MRIAPELRLGSLYELASYGGVPTFFTGVGTGNGGRIPKRFQYPASERNYNAANYKAALTSQFGARTDDINSEIWLIK